ncbi:hypothetical protein HD554DRAFT_833093 [Boletus coccyginus]|nr:hypothetical protein HD554DRAFT_833093 [Boletus coccyginus]
MRALICVAHARRAGLFCLFDLLTVIRSHHAHYLLSKVFVAACRKLTSRRQLAVSPGRLSPDLAPGWTIRSLSLADLTGHASSARCFAIPSIRTTSQ